MAGTVRRVGPEEGSPRPRRGGFAAAWAVALGLVLAPAAQAGELGNSGLHVERTPQSLLVTGLDANSPAALAHLPAMNGRVMRLLYVNGIPALDLLKQGELASAFRARTVLVTLGVREKDALEERVAGPFVLDLIDSAQSRLKRLVASRQWLKVASLASTGELRPEESEAAWARVALEAATYARSEQWKLAIELGQTIPLSDPAYRLVSSQLPAWRTALRDGTAEDRKLLAREVVHSGPNPRRLAASKKGKDRQGSKPRKDRDS